MWRTSGWANTALSDAIVMSAASWYQKPPPMAQPLTAAMIGVPSRHMCSHCPTRSPSRWCQYLMNSAIDLPVGIAAALLARRRLLVEAGAERGARAGQDDHLHLRVGVGLVEGAMQLGFEIARERVHAVRPVERDGRDLVGTL